MEYKKALSKAMTICSRAEQCSYDILEKLKKWGVSEIESQKIIDILYNERFIDDGRFAEAYVKDKFRFNSWGKQKISYMLKQKGVSSATINSALQSINENEYFAKALEELEKKNRLLDEEDQYMRKAKLIRFLASRGFEHNLIIKAVESIL